MKSRRVEALDIVEEDMRYAMSFYDSWRSDGSAYFKVRFDETVEWIAWNPEMFPKKYRLFRRAIVKNTYFGAFYVIEPDVTTIVAVCDLRRSPKALRHLLHDRR